VADEAAHFLVAKQHKRERRARVPVYPSGPHPQWPNVFPLDPQPLKGSNTSQYYRLWTKPSTHGHLRNTVLVTFHLALTKIPERIAYLRNYLFWLMVSEVSVHHGGESLAGQTSSHHGGQKAEKGIQEGARANRGPLPSIAPSDLLLTARPHLLLFVTC
jgi:hypothetical protein